ncbi:MAG: aminotransferase class V-fold PLP-dependent enzyme, partial [Rhodothermales bacterium]|nr:aminotransferase class V-fold PLP-dependent enzyme [Rhodothermales bacterium]
SEEVAITHNTTELFNPLANGLPLKRGDEVVFSSLNHAGASVCWEMRSGEKDFSVRRFDFPATRVSEMTTSDVVSLYEDAIGPNTSVLVLPHIDNMVGLRHPLKEIATMAHDRGVRWVAVDGAQTAGMIPLDLQKTGVDFYATSAHKWIQSPKGLGLAYISKRVQEDLNPMWVTWGQKRWNGTAREFEDYGTRALPAVIALGDALSFLSVVPASLREGHHKQLWRTMQELVADNPAFAWRSPREWQLGGALYAIETRGKKSAEVSARIFSDHGFVVRPFAMGDVNTLRVSPNVTNTIDELQQFLEVVGR